MVRLLHGLQLGLLLVLCSGCGLTGYGRTADDLDLKPIYHRVAAGDTLYQISKQYRVTPKRLAYLNGIKDPKSVPVGRRLLVGYRGNADALERSAKNYHGGPAEPRVQNASLSSKSQVPELNEGVTRRGGRLGWPLRQGRIVSGFGSRGGGFHDGLDLATPQGTPVYAAQDGQVVYSDDGLSGYGNLVIIKGRDAFSTVYAHNRRNLVDVGDRVRRGQKIAEVGSTGRSSGPHLHFEVRMRDIHGRYVAMDPLPLLNYAPDARYRYRRNERLTPILNAH